MRSTVNSVDFYSSLPATTLDTDKMHGSITAQCCDEFDSNQNCEAVEIEISAKKLDYIVCNLLRILQYCIVINYSTNF